MNPELRDALGVIARAGGSVSFDPQSIKASLIGDGGRNPAFAGACLGSAGNLPSSNELVTVAEYAKRVGKSPKTVHRWIKTGKVEATPMPGGRGWLVSPPTRPAATTPTAEPAGVLTLADWKKPRGAKSRPP